MKLTLLVVLLLVLTGCAAPPSPYRPEGRSGGFRDTWLTPDTFRVVFNGNGFTTAERAQDLALLRASELSLQRGFVCFAVLNENSFTRVESFTIPGHSETSASGSADVWYGYQVNGRLNSQTTYMPPQTQTWLKPETGLLVRGFQTKPEGVATFDADFISHSLKGKYGIKSKETFRIPASDLPSHRPAD